MSRPRVVVCGYGEYGVAALETLLGLDAHIVAAVAPGNRSGPEVERFLTMADGRGVYTCLQPSRAAIDPFVEDLRALSPDVILTWSYSMKLPPSVLEVPVRGAVNVHTALLPEYRGGHVLQWALINGEAETGVTLHHMDEGIDTGPVIGQTRFALETTDDAVSVKAKMKPAGVALLRRWWPRIVDGTAPRARQDETRARYWRMRTPEDGAIDWSQTADGVCRLVRALRSNTPGAFVRTSEGLVTIRRAYPVPPGEVADGVRVRAADADVLVTEAEFMGTVLRGAALASLPRIRPDRPPTHTSVQLFAPA